MGGDLQGGDLDARREAARLMGSVTSDRKAEAARQNGRKSVFTPEMREKLVASQRARRERERLVKEGTVDGTE